MATRWSPTPDGVRARATGPGPAASLAAGLLTIAGTTLALLIAAAILFPGPYGVDDAGVAAASPSAAPARPAATQPAPTSAPTPLASAPVASPGAPAVVPTIAPDPSSAPTAAADPSAPAASQAPTLAQMRQPAALTVGGREVGLVTVQAVREVAASSAEVPAGRRLMVAQVRLDAVRSRLPYDELHWRLEDENGDRWDPIAQAAPRPLGSGTLAPDAGLTGGVAFVMPAGVKVRAVVLTDGSGADLVVFTRPSVTG